MMRKNHKAFDSFQTAVCFILQIQQIEFSNFYIDADHCNCVLHLAETLSIDCYHYEGISLRLK